MPTAPPVVLRWPTEDGCTIRSISGLSIGARVESIYLTRQLEIRAERVLALERSHALRLPWSEEASRPRAYVGGCGLISTVTTASSRSAGAYTVLTVP